MNIVANGDNLPFKDDSLDYVLSSHVIEHFFDPIAAIAEWLRVVKPVGIIFMIIPHMERTFDKRRPLTAAKELLDRHSGKLQISDYAALPENAQYNEDAEWEPHADYLICGPADERHIQCKKDGDNFHHHWSVWRLNNFLEMCAAAGFNVVETRDPDDKVGNCFTVVLRKRGAAALSDKTSVFPRCNM